MFFIVLVACNCLWVLSLPVFPSQDGPVHLYYVSILHHLAEGSNLFTQYFTVRHPVPPYSFQYLLLYLLTDAMDFLMAEKVVVCLFIVAFCFGFRFLVRSVNPNAEVLALCGIPLSLNWMLGMGFTNYCLSLAFSLFAAGFWLRFVKSKSTATGVAFLAIVLLILFTHPVPLLILLAFIWSQIAVETIQSYLRQRTAGTARLTEELKTRTRQVVLALLASSSIGYVFLFVSAKKTSDNLHHPFLQLGMIKDYLLLHPLVMTYGTMGARVYRICLYVLLAGAFWISYRGFFARFRSGTLKASDLLSAGAALLAVVYPFLPRSINGSDFFADRLALYIWLFAIAGAAFDFQERFRPKKALVVGMACVVLFALALNDSQIRPTAQVLMQIETDRLKPAGETGIFVYAPVQPSEKLITFDPYLWSSTRYFRRANLIMLNAPWLDLPILPVGPTDKLFTNLFPARILNYPDRFVGQILKSQQVRDLVSARSQFILFVGYTSRDPKVVDNVLKQSWPHPWGCNRTGWYSVCSN